MKDALVVGAGVAGCSAALELARQGSDVSVLETSGRIGGRVLSYCCKATDSCSRCGVCVAHTTVAQSLRHPKITLLTGAAISSVARTGGKIEVRGALARPGIAHRRCMDCRKCVEACPQGAISRYSRAGLTQYGVDYLRCLLSSGKRCLACGEACEAGAISTGDGSGKPRTFKLAVSRVVVAVGHETFDPVAKPRLGYRRIPEVMTGLEAEEALAARTDLGAGSVAFLQCVGSRDPSIGRNYCSSVCCAYALRMARMLKSRNPATEVTVYTIDVQHFDKAQRAFREGVEAVGVKLVRGVPSSISRYADGKLHLQIEDPASGATTAVHDRAVLSVGMGPTAGARRLAELFGLETGEHGFLRSSAADIQVAGTCAAPQGLIDAMASGRAAAVRLAP